MLMNYNKTSITENSFDETIKMRDNNNMLTSKLYGLLYISANKMRDNYANFKC